MIINPNGQGDKAKPAQKEVKESVRAKKLKQAEEVETEVVEDGDQE